VPLIKDWNVIRSCPVSTAKDFNTFMLQVVDNLIPF
jgi:hypothetical protein